MISPKYSVYVATGGVFLGACITSLSQRLLSVGLPDLRGALGLSVGEGAWIASACDMGLMFMGGLTAYIGVVLGWRRTLLVTTLVYALASSAIPLVSSYWSIIGLQVVVGLSAGTFFPLSLSYALSTIPAKHTIYAVAVYVIVLLITLSISTALQAWFVEHWSYRWMFWAGPVLAVPMWLLIYLALHDLPKPTARRPKVSFAGLAYACLAFALLYGALQQGQRPGWLDSGTVAAMLLSGAALLCATAYIRVTRPNPLVNLRFLGARNTLLLAVGLLAFRFAVLSMLLLVPGFLGVVKGYAPRETGRVLAMSVGPIVISGLVAAFLMRRWDGRVVVTVGFLLVGSGALVNASLTSAWVGADFGVSQLLLAAGLTCSLVGLIGMVAQQLRATGAVGDAGIVRPVDVLTYASFWQVVRLFGGQVMTSFMQQFVDLREVYHSDRLSASLQADELVRREAYTLAFADGFALVVWVCIAAVFTTLLVKRMDQASS